MARPGLSKPSVSAMGIGERKGEPLVFFPLFLKDDREARAGDDEGDGHGEPPVQRRQPPAPRDARALGKALVVGADNLGRRLGQTPPGQNVKENFFPSVFGRGVVKRRADHAAPIGRPSTCRDRAHDPRHAVDDQQLCAGQSHARPREFEHEVDREPGDKGQEHGHGQLRFDQRGGSQDHARVVAVNIEPGSGRRAEEHSADRNAPRTRGFGL